MATQHQVDLELSQFRERYHRLNAHIREHVRSPEWVTPCELLQARDSIKVRHFSSSAPAEKPLLIVYSQVNSPHIIDLHPEHSMVQRLIESGQDVYLLNWGQVQDSDRDNDLSHYAVDYIDAAVDCIVDRSGAEKVNLLGICQGGTFILCYASLVPEKVGKLVTLVTPVDFHGGESLLTNWARHVDTTLMEKHPRNVNGPILTRLFQSMRPFNDLQRQVELIDRPEAPQNMPLVTLMDQWVHHCPDQPGLAFAQFVRLFFQENGLVTSELQLGGRSTRLDNIASPVLNVYAAHDHIVPPASSSALQRFIAPEDYEERVFDGGHIGLLVSKKAQTTLLPDVGRWLSGPS